MATQVQPQAVALAVVEVPPELRQWIAMNAQYQVLLCVGNGCHKALSPGSMAEHLCKVHKAVPNERRQVQVFMQALGWAYNYATVRLPADRLAPQPVIQGYILHRILGQSGQFPLLPPEGEGGRSSTPSSHLAATAHCCITAIPASLPSIASLLLPIIALLLPPHRCHPSYHCYCNHIITSLLSIASHHCHCNHGITVITARVNPMPASRSRKMKTKSPPFLRRFARNFSSS